MQKTIYLLIILKMKKYISHLFVTLLLTLTLGMVNQEASANNMSYSEFQSPTNSVEVIGIGKIYVNPDTAIIDIGVETTSKTSKESQNLNKENSKKIIEELEKIGVDKKDIKTQWYNIYPNYEYDETGQKLNGYTTNHTLSLKIRDLKKVSQILENVIENGATNISNVQYTLENQRNLYDKARNLAAKNAKEKAKKIGEVLQFNIGDIIRVEEFSNDDFIYAESTLLGKGMNDMTINENIIQSKKIEIRLTLNITFAIKK